MRFDTPFALARPSWRGVQVLTLVAVLLCFLVTYAATWGQASGYLPHVVSGWRTWEHSGVKLDGGAGSGDNGHPIEQLMRTAELHFSALVTENPTSVDDAARKYRQKRGRHPPPGFDTWYAYATAHGALVPEAFFDQIYRDLGPFWGVDVDTLRRNVRGFSPKVTVREGVAGSSVEASYERVRAVVAMLKKLGKEGVMLPDMDIPLNTNDEVAMLVPWETMETAIEFARKFMPPPMTIVEAFSALNDDGAEDVAFDPQWLDNRLHHKTGGAYLGPRPLWSLVRPACPPNSPARKQALMADIWHPEGHTSPEHSASELVPLQLPANSSEGYVANWTVGIDGCLQPELQGLHGAFVAPKSMSITQKLFPLFSTSKMSVSNEILMPSFQTANSSITAFARPWKEKEAKLYWRGPASGGVNSKLNWRRMHRHRIVSMLNATHVEIAEAMLHAGNESTVGRGYAGNFRLLPANTYNLATQKGATMAEWVSGWADVAFTDLQCDEPAENGTCSYTDEFFSTKQESGHSQAKYKYAAVLDGDAGDDGGEIVQRLEEGRAVLRSSVYKQWYDDRLIPWLHFVPLDNIFMDLYGAMEYFLGTSIQSPSPEFPHAHVEVEKHEHHFQTPHWDEEDNEEVDSGGHCHEEYRRRSINTKGRADGNEGGGHDAQAQKIAEAGQKWAEKVLRGEDILIYMYRLLLEYARVVDQKRHTLGWVGDLLEEGK